MMWELTTSQKISLSYSLLTILSLLVFFGIYELSPLFVSDSSILLILRLGLIAVLVLMQYYIWRFLSRYLLRDLKYIAQELSKLWWNSIDARINCKLPKNDEISILVEALNNSYRARKTETQKLKQFQTDVSHEFKTPLMVMQSRLDVLEKKHEKWMLTHDEQQDFFTVARKNILKMNTLIETLFFLSCCEDSDWGCLQRTRINMLEFFQSKKEDILLQFPERNIQFILNVEPDLYYHIGRVSFSILVNNLIENAIKFWADSITLTATNTYFSVSDNGVWIPELEQKKIFEKFYRSDINKEWFWVWLSLVKRISEMYQWKIELKSTEWEGAEFRCIF